jgi:hypothetical protein
MLQDSRMTLEEREASNTEQIALGIAAASIA